MRIPTFLLLVVLALMAVGAGPASAGIQDPHLVIPPQRLGPQAPQDVPESETFIAAQAVVAGGALSLLSPADAILRLAAALNPALADVTLLQESIETETMTCPTPSQIEVIDNFGQRRGSHRHTGVDIRAPHSSAIRAALPGTVETAGYDGAYGLTVTVRDLAGDIWLYAHMSSTSVRAGQLVPANASLGAVGCTGRCTGAHLHIEHRPNGGAPVDTYARLVKACR